jgi:hypothetical protein
MLKSQMGEKVRAAPSPLEQRKKMMADDPDTYGVLANKPGAEYLSGIQAMLQQREAEAEKQRAENARLKELNTYAAISKAAEATRGMRGGRGSQLAAMLGSFGQQMGGIEKESVEREQALREDLLKRRELQNAAKFEIEKLQIARADGDVKGEQVHAANLAKLENELRVSQNNLLKGAITGAYGAAGRAYAADIAAKAKIKAAGITSAASAEEKRQNRLMRNAEFLEKMEATWANTLAKNPEYKELSRQKGFIELQRSIEKDPTKLAKLDTQLDDVNASMIELSNKLRSRNVGGGGAGSSTQTGKAPPPPPGFKVN